MTKSTRSLRSVAQRFFSAMSELSLLFIASIFFLAGLEMPDGALKYGEEALSHLWVLIPSGVWVLISLTSIVLGLLERKSAENTPL